MAKIDNTYIARMEGMAKALEIAEKDGIEALRKEIMFRNVNFVPLEIDRKTLTEVYGILSARIVQTLLTMVFATLRDSKGWGSKRLSDFKAEFERKCLEVDAIDINGEHYARISDYAEMLEQECGIKMDLETILKVQQDTDKNDRRLN